MSNSSNVQGVISEEEWSGLSKKKKLKALYAKGEEIFGDRKRFNTWLRRRSYPLGNIYPIDQVKTVAGITLIYDELIRIEFGATA